MNRKVKVFKLSQNGWELFHRGIVVGETNSFLRVFNPEKDITPASAEWFAKSATLIYCQYE
jgi:hypothetical protein